MVNDVPPALDLLREAERAAASDPDQADAAQATYLANTFPILPTAVPPIVEVDQWERVQVKLKDAADLNNRGGPRRTDAAANSTLLDGGYIRCAECGGKMARHWETKSIHPYYRCYTSADRPSHPHIGFTVPAHHVDALARRLLAKALTDPEKILELASAAEGKFAEANADALLAASALAAYHKRIATITEEHDMLRAALINLRGTTGIDSVVQGIEMRLAELDSDREEAEDNYEHAIPLRDHAQARADFLRQVFMVQRHVIKIRPEGVTISPRDPELRIGYHDLRRTADGELERYTRITVLEAATLLGVSVDELEAMELPIERGQEVDVEIDYEVWGTEMMPDTVASEDVIELLLAKMPRDRVRKMLHDLDAVVKVTRGRTRAEIQAGVAKVPLAKRVYLELLGTVQVRTDVKKLKTSS